MSEKKKKKKKKKKQGELLIRGFSPHEAADRLLLLFRGTITITIVSKMVMNVSSQNKADTYKCLF